MSRIPTQNIVFVQMLVSNQTFVLNGAEHYSVTPTCRMLAEAPLLTKKFPLTRATNHTKLQIVRGDLGKMLLSAKRDAVRVF